MSLQGNISIIVILPITLMIYIKNMRFSLIGEGGGRGDWDGEHM